MESGEVECGEGAASHPGSALLGSLTHGERAGENRRRGSLTSRNRDLQQTVKFRKWGNRVLGVSSAIICLGCAGIVPSHWKYDPGKKWKHYFDSEGLAAGSVAGVTFNSAIYFLLMSPKMKVRDPRPLTYVFPKDDGHGSNSVAAVFGADRESIAAQVLRKDRLLSLAQLAFPALVNIVGFLNAVINLPTRDPDLPMNFPAHVMPVLELSIFFIFLTEFLRYLYSYFHIDKSSACPSLRDVALLLRILGSFSSIAFSNLFAFKASRRFGKIVSGKIHVTWKSFAKLAFYTTGALMGLVGLFVKIATVKFVGEITIDQWTFSDLISLALFVNNVYKMGMSFELKTKSQGLCIVEEFVRLASDEEDSEKDWVYRFCSELITKYGRLRAAVFFLTLQVDEAHMLLNEKKREMHEARGPP